MDDHEGFKTSLEEVSADVVETVREVEWEVELQAVTELLQFHNKTLTDEELLQMSKEGGFLRWKLFWWRWFEDYWNEDRGDLEHYINSW